MQDVLVRKIIISSKFDQNAIKQNPESLSAEIKRAAKNFHKTYEGNFCRFLRDRHYYSVTTSQM